MRGSKFSQSGFCNCLPWLLLQRVYDCGGLPTTVLLLLLRVQVGLNQCGCPNRGGVGSTICIGGGHIAVLGYCGWVSGAVFDEEFDARRPGILVKCEIRQTWWASTELRIVCSSGSLAILDHSNC